MAHAFNHSTLKAEAGGCHTHMAGAGEIAQWLQLVAVLAEELGLSLSI